MFVFYKPKFPSPKKNTTLFQVTENLQQLNLYTQILNMPAQSTQSASVNQAGYGSDVSEGQNRQTSRVTTPVKRPGMIQPSSDSRRSIGQPTNVITNNPTKKRKNVPSDSETESQITPIASKKKGKKAAKNPPTCSQSTIDPSSSQVINLAQDSDEENAKVKHKRQRKNPDFDDIKSFFSEPYRCKGDVSEMSLIKYLLYILFSYTF